MSPNSNILMTGATGFVGQNLSAYLEETGYTIFPISLRGKDWKNKITDSFKTYIHLAGKAHDLKNVSDDKVYFEVNTELTQLLFEQFLQSSAETFIYFSSVKAAADSVAGELTELTNASPETAYGKSKLAAEHYLLSQAVPSQKRIIILRPCMIHGPGNKGNLNLLYQFVNSGIPYPLAAYDNKRSFLSIENLCFVIEKILSERRISSGIYNLADDNSISTNELVNIIGDTIHKRARLLKIPKRLMAFVAKWGDALRLPLNSNRLQKLTENYIVSNAKIKQALEIDKMPVSIAEGLRKTIASFKHK